MTFMGERALYNLGESITVIGHRRLGQRRGVSVLRYWPAGSSHLLDQRRAARERRDLWQEQNLGERRLHVACIVDCEGRQGDVSVLREKRLRDGPGDGGAASRW